MALVGEVTLEVRADTTKVAGQLRRDLDGASKGSAAAGAASGKSYKTAFVASADGGQKAIAAKQAATAAAAGAASGRVGGQAFSVSYTQSAAQRTALAAALTSQAAPAGAAAGKASGNAFRAAYVERVRSAGAVANAALAKQAVAGGAAAGAAGGKAAAAAQAAAVSRTTGAAGLAGLGAVAGPAGIAAAAVTVLGVSAVKAAAGFEDSLAKSLALFPDASDKARKAAADTAKTLSSDLNISAKDAAEGYFFLGSAGLDLEQSMAALPATLAFAKAGNLDAATATDILTDAQSSLGLTVDDSQKNLENMTRISDVLGKANLGANATVEQFGNSLTNKFGASLKTANKDVEEGVALLSVFADQGLKGLKAGETGSAFLRDLGKAAATNGDAFDELGIKVFDSQGNLENFGDIADSFTDALGGMSDEAFAAALQQLGLTEVSQDATKRILGQGDALREYESSLRDSGGAIDTLVEENMGSLNEQLGRLKQSLVNTLINIGTPALPALTAGVSALANAISSPAFQQGLADVQAALGSFFGSIGAFASSGAGQFLIGLFGTALAQAFDVFVTALRNVGETIQFITNLLQGDFGAAGQNLKNIFGNVGGLIERTFGRITGLFGGLPSSVSGAVGGIRSALSGIGSSIAGAFSGLGSRIVGALSGTPGQIASVFLNVPAAIVNALASLGNDLASTIGDAVAGIPGAVGDKAVAIGKAILDGVLNGLAGAPGQILDKLTPDLGGLSFGLPDVGLPSIPTPSLSNPFSNPFGGGGGGAPAAPVTVPVQADTEAFSASIQAAASALAAAGDTVKIGVGIDQAKFSQALAALGGGEGGALSEVKIPVGVDTAKFSEALGALAAAQGATETAFELAVTPKAAEGSIEALAASFGTGESVEIPVIPKAADGALAALKNSLGGGTSAELPVKIKVDKQGLSSFRASIAGQSIPGPTVKVTKFNINAASAAGAARSAGSAITKAVAGGVTSGASVVNTAVSGVISGAISAGQTAAGAASSIGSALSSGIAAGINGAGISAKIAGIVGRAIAAGKARARAASPSKATRDEIGIPLSEGIAAGIEDGGEGVRRAMKKVVGDAVKAGRTAISVLTQRLGKDIANATVDAVNAAKQGLSSLAGSLGGSIGELIDERSGNTLDAFGEKLANAQQASAALQQQLADLSKGTLAQEIAALQASQKRLSVDRQRATLVQNLSDKLDEQKQAQEKIAAIEAIISGREGEAPEVVITAEQALLGRLRADAAAIPRSQQEALDRFDEDQATTARIAGLQAQLDAQKAALTEEQRLSQERVQAVQKEIETFRAQSELRKKLIAEGLNDLTTGLNTGTITLKEYNAGVNKLLKNNQVKFGQFAKQVNATAAFAFRDFIVGLRKQAKALAGPNAPRVRGTGNAAQISDPFGVLSRERSARINDLQQQVTSLRSQSNLDKKQQRELTKLTSELTKLRKNPPKQVTTIVNAQVLDEDKLVKKIEQRVRRGLLSIR